MVTTAMAAALLTLAAGLPADQILVTTDQLAHMKDAIIVDTRSEAEYNKGHIPGAFHLEAPLLSETKGGVKGLLRPPDEIRKLLEGAGLDPTKHIVLYGAMEKPEDMTNAPRAFWVLEQVGFDKVSILDGGFGKWQAEHRPIETAQVQPYSVDLSQLKPRPETVATAEEVARAVKEGDATILDMRPPEFYSGEKKKDYVARAGHIPKAADVPPSALVAGEHHTFADPEKLKATLSAAGATPDKRVITYCNSGRSASVGYFALRRAGYKNVAVYDGSMAEWASKPDNPVEEGKQDK